MSIRITGGDKGGYRMVLPRDLEGIIRPTQDKVRQAMFSSLSSYMDIKGSRVLDLFSGTGLLSFEALSRGAISSIAVDKVHKVQRYSRDIATQLAYDKNVSFIVSDVLKYLETCSEQAFDLIFIDPPYGKFSMSEIVSKILDKKLLLVGGAIVYEEESGFFSSQFENLEDRIRAQFKRINFKKYGSTSVCLYFY